MPGNAFIRFEVSSSQFAPGESQQIGHAGKEGWIEIGEWSWDVEAEASHLKGTGASVGKPQPGVLSFSHYYDRSSALLMQYIVKGTHFDAARIHMLKQTGKDQPELFFELAAKDVFITKVSSKGGEDGGVSQDVEFVFKQVAVGYKQQGNDGKFVSDGFRQFMWNIATMNTTLDGLALQIK
jgi:type VI secretion system secreted protein Hcp